MKRRYMILFILIAVIVVVLAFGPRPAIDNTVSFDAEAIGPDPDAYLARSEASVAGIRPGAEKEIIWASPGKTKTDRVIVYLHGFSATKMETRPLPDDLARGLDANLFYTRLTGHGRDGNAMAEATMNAWINDTAEAIGIGERLGGRIILMGASTGATLATWAAARPSLMANVEALVLISPNYAVRGASIGMLNMPWGESLLPLVMGRTRSFEPHNEEHARWWTTSYPSRAVLAMGALLKATRTIEFEELSTPAMFVFSPDDQVIEPRAVLDVFERWGGPKAILRITDSDDPSQHVIAGDILSPSTTARIAEDVLGWLQSVD